MQTPLLKTKLRIPPTPESIVNRQGLYDRIENGLKRRLTLVAAPAGFGKTTFISSWAHRNKHPVAWVSLDDNDNQSNIFWSYMVEGLRNALQENSENFLDQINIAELPSIQTLLIHLLNGLSELKRKVILVLDDYHVISNSEIHNDFAYLIENQPLTLHIVLITRADPPLPIPRLRGHGLMTEFRSGDLRFTIAETTSFLNEVMGLRLTAEDISVLEKRTEGWIIGLQLAALSMQNRSDKSGFIESFSGGHHFILEYLMEEVIVQLPEHLRKFLMQTSILNRFNASLCNHIVQNGNSITQIEYLQQNNLFIIALDDEHIWYRYHQLFKDLLQVRLNKNYTSGHILELHHRAGEWYLEEHEFEEAIRYFLLAQDYELGADLFEKIVDQVISRGQVAKLLQWIGSFPDHFIKSHPSLLIHQGWIYFLSGKASQATQILLEAKHLLGADIEIPDQVLLSGRLSALLATCNSLTRDLSSAVEDARYALTVLPDNEPIYKARAMRALGVSIALQGDLQSALNSLEKAKQLALSARNKFLAAEICSQIATVHNWEGKLSLAADAYQQILELYEHPELAPPACLGYIGLAEIELERNHLHLAEDYLDTGIQLCNKGNIGYALQPAYLKYSLLKHAFGDVSSALEFMQKGDYLSRQGDGSLESILGLAQYQARLCMLLGEHGKAMEWVTGERLPSGWSFEDLPVSLEERYQSLFARVSLAINDYAKVLDICEHVIPQAETSGRLRCVIELTLYKALALLHLGDGESAFESFCKCLVLAESEGYVRLFLEVGESVEGLLQRAISRGIFSEYAKSLLELHDNLSGSGKSVITDTQRSYGIIEQLTPRELQVLKLMCEGYTNQHIAELLVLSVNTIKKHTSNIYSKLGVLNRAHAVLRAREIGLI